MTVADLGPTIITGTGTDVGKTVATAAMAAFVRLQGVDVGICKPIQTGLAPGEPGDADEAARLSGVSRVLEVRRLADPLAPETAARVAGLPQSTLDELVTPIQEWLDSPGEPSAPGRLDLIEGAGGVLVRLGTDLTILDLAAAFEAPLVVVARAGLGTLSDTELTVRAIRSAGLACAGIVIGSWPAEPSLAERCNLEDLPRLTGVPVIGRIPVGAGKLSPEEFARQVPGWFGSGSEDAAAAHAARHMSVYNRPDYLADQLRHAAHPAADLAEGNLAAMKGHRSELTAAEHFRAMREHRASKSSAPYEGPSTT